MQVYLPVKNGCDLSQETMVYMGEWD